LYYLPPAPLSLLLSYPLSYNNAYSPIPYQRSCKIISSTSNIELRRYDDDGQQNIEGVETGNGGGNPDICRMINGLKNNV